MNETVSRVRTHVKKHQEAYITGSVFIAFAGITYLVMRDRHATLPSGVDGLKTADASVTVRPISFFSSQKNEIVTTIHSGSRGHPGFITRCLETGLSYETQGAAARAYDISPSILSTHLNGLIENADGLHFERIAA